VSEITTNIFLLTGDWFDYNGRNYLRLYGKSNDIGAVEVIIKNNKPVFFIKRDSYVLHSGISFYRKQVNLKNFDGEFVDALYFNTYRESKKAIDYLEKYGIKTYESDVDPLKRFLMERLIFMQMKLTGEAIKENNITKFINPKIAPCEINPDLLIASLDIETSGNGNDIYSIALHIWNSEYEIKKVFIIGQKTKNFPEYISFCKSEIELITSFIDWFNKIDPDIIIGWHIVGFDLLYLEKKCNELNLNFNLGRNAGRLSIIKKEQRGYFASLPGRVIIDGPTALRTSFFNFEDYKLETVAQELLGMGKNISSDENKVKEIERLFIEDKILLAEYNLQDALLVSEIFKKVDLIGLYVKRAQISGLFMDQLGMMTAAFDHFYLPQLHKKGFVAPNVKDIITTEHAEGGYVLEPEPGIYENIVVLDFKSLYPSIIRTFKIDPYSLLMKAKNTVLTPNGYKFSFTDNILPDYIDKLLENRKEAIFKGDKQLSQAIKILMNSFYGVMGSFGCRFFHPDLPRAITGTGHKLLIGSKDYLETLGYKVIYGDTDSLFIKLKDVFYSEGENQGIKLAEVLNNYWKEKLKNDFNVQSYLELEFEKFYEKFVITPARGSETGAKKRYVGLINNNGNKKIEFVGMEFVRSDWTKLAKEFQEELYMKIFQDEEIDEFIRNTIRNLKEGKFDNKLIYRKRLRKDIDNYTKNIPPHVRAAKMLREPGDVVYYVITERGPIPVQFKYNDLDYNHYIEKQLKPIAEAVLSLLGKSFDSIVISDQMRIF